MDQKEHIATLCALGTVGVAAAGLAFGTDQVESHILRPGKRKWPGSSNNGWSVSTISPALPRRSVSQPTTPLLPSEPPSLASQSVQSIRISSVPKAFVFGRGEAFQDEPSSRASSTSRRSILRPRTATSRSTTTDKRESSASSNWLKRLSSFSSHSSSPAPSIKFPDKDETAVTAIYGQRPSTSDSSMPNKLVKRSVSQRGLSYQEARGQILKRPATSHQRSQTFRDILSRPVSNMAGHTNHGDIPEDAAVSVPQESYVRLWKPFFETAFPRKRRRSESATDPSQIRVILLSSIHKPIMLLGSELDDSERTAEDDRPQPQPQPASEPTTTSRRSRRSLSSLRRITRRRNFTDPSIQVTHTAANGTISPVNPRTQMSPTINGAIFDNALPHGTPQLTSSPLLSQFDRTASFRLRDSMSASDPPTTGSDVDGRVFSDEESLDFRSDTAYDSIATRATNLSHSGIQNSKLDTIFAARTSDEAEARSDMWQSLSREEDDAVMQNSPFHNHDNTMHGIGISVSDVKHDSDVAIHIDASMTTPPRSASFRTEDHSITPVPLKFSNTDFDSSPPMLPTITYAREYDQVGDMLEDMKLDDNEEMIWSADSDFDFEPEPVTCQPDSRQIMSSPGGVAHPMLARFQEDDETDEYVNGNGKAQKPSIFDWSEHQQLNNFARPKTVHGKQSNGDRSRSSGRKGPPQLHFRSQSVPVNKEAPKEDVATTAKYQTWRLGAKPVSEEWSDDFEFDDAEDAGVASLVVDNSKNDFRGSVRSVKIPQAIMDRQPSVHLQFGQVQEFMALVEELKRLRSQGLQLHILNGHAKNLWEDAESIINLATINDEEEPLAPMVASSPTSSDPFAEITNAPAVTVLASRGRRPTTTGRRSVSTMTTPPVHGRARGESLAQARHFLQAIHQNRSGFDSSPREIEIHHQKKLPFDTQDLKDLVVRSGAITRALKEEIRRAEGVTISPQKTPKSSRDGRGDDDHPLNNLFRIPEPQEASPCPPFRKPGLPKSRSAHSYLESSGSRQHSVPFSSPISLTAAV